MQRKLHDALASHADEYEVVRELHNVPPHVTYEVVVDGTRAVCKLATGSEGDPAMEARVMEYVAENTSVPVPEILAVGPDYFVAKWHEDVPATGANTDSSGQQSDGVSTDDAVDEERARAMGAGLARFHDEAAFESTGFLRTGNESLELDTRETWHETVRDFLAKRRDFLRDIGHADVADEALAFVRERPGLFAGAGDPVLCHGNYLPDHVGVENGAVTCLIDFEHALVGPGEYDFWRTWLPLRSNESAEAADAFRDGYEGGRSLPSGFDRRREAYLLVDTVSYLRSLHLQNQHSAAETKRRAEAMRRYVLDTIDSLREESV